jgi:protein subunit release factor A
VEVTLYNLANFIEGDLDSLLEPLMIRDLETRLEALRT